jgi:hypothetical protein
MNNTSQHLARSDKSSDVTVHHLSRPVRTRHPNHASTSGTRARINHIKFSHGTTHENRFYLSGTIIRGTPKTPNLSW